MADKDSKSIIKPGAIPIYEAPDGLKVYREEDIRDDARQQLKKQREELERKARDQPTAEGWDYAVVEHELPESADAAIVRSPDPMTRPLLVFQTKSLTDRLVSLARVALVYSEATSKPLTSQQLVLVWADGSLKIDGTADRMENLMLSEQGESANFRRISGTPRSVHGLGEVRVVGGVEDF